MPYYHAATVKADSVIAVDITGACSYNAKVCTNSKQVNQGCQHIICTMSHVHAHVPGPQFMYVCTKYLLSDRATSSVC